MHYMMSAKLTYLFGYIIPIHQYITVQTLIDLVQSIADIRSYTYFSRIVHVQYYFHQRWDSRWVRNLFVVFLSLIKTRNKSNYDLLIVRRH